MMTPIDPDDDCDDPDPLASIEYADTPEGRARWQAVLDEIAAEREAVERREDGSEGEPMVDDGSIPF